METPQSQQQQQLLSIIQCTYIWDASETQPTKARNKSFAASTWLFLATIATHMAHRGETQKQTSRSNDTYCVNKPTETSCVCFSVLSRSKLQMVATSAARRRDKNDLCLTCVGVVDVATRCSFVATQLVATRCSFVSLRCSFVSFRVQLCLVRWALQPTSHAVRSKVP
jgi:hypothetical protein